MLENPIINVLENELGIHAENQENQGETNVIRVEPLSQQNASSADVERGLRLIQLCRDGNSEAARQLVLEGAPAGFITKSYWTPLAAAAYSGNVELVSYLLEIGADGMYTTSKRLHKHLSAMNELTGSTSSIKYDTTAAFHEKDVKKTIVGSNTPLHWACYQGYADVTSILLNAGFGIEDIDPVGNRPLHLACSGGYSEVVEVLLAHSVSVDKKNKYGNTPLDLSTDPNCRKLIRKFITHTTCEWCKDAFSRTRRPSLCQHCHNIYCDTKPCSTTNEIAICTSTATKQVRYCQECATEMGRADLELRSLLDTKLKLVQDALAAIHLHTTTRGDTAKRDPNPAHNDVECSGENGGTGFTNETEAAGSSTDIDSAISLGSVPSTPSASHSSSDVNVKKHLTFDEIQRALVLHRTDAESLHTAIDAAQTKAVDTRIIEKAKKIYEQLSSHISLQEEVKALLASCPIAVRSLVDPLKNALQNARKDNVDPRMLYLVEKVIQSAEAECTLFGAESLTSHITLGSKKYAKEIARLEAAILQAEQYGVTGTLLNNTIRLRNRLNAEVAFEANLQNFTQIPDAITGQNRYVFVDGTEVSTLLQALELRNTRVTSALEIASHAEGVATSLVEEAHNIQKHLKKDIKEETKNEEERRKLEEEAALKAAKKKGKKKKA